MNITEVNISLVKPKEGMIAFASVVLEGQLLLGSIAVHRKLSGGFRLTYPTKKIGEENSHVFHPIHRELGHAIEQAVFNKLKEVTGGSHAGHDYSTPPAW